MLLLVSFLNLNSPPLKSSTPQFHLPPMGNSAPHRLPSAAGKVILSDGGVFTYDMPLTVAELMLEHPQQVVVEFQPEMHVKKPTPLPADHKLDMKKLYLMIPIRKGKPTPLSSDGARRILENTNSLLKSKALMSFTGIVPLFVRICPAVGGRSDAASMRKKKYCLCEGKEEEREENIKSDYFMDILEGRPEFLSRQVSGKGWKPSLDPIREKAIEPKVNHWILNK